MKIAVCTVAYNEEEWIGQCIDQFRPFNYHHLVLLSALPWNGTPVESDRTKQIATQHGAEVIIQHWLSEHDQRNFGLARLYDYDYVLIVDADELYTQEDIVRIEKALESREHCYRATGMVTYWKTPEYILDPPDKHKPIIAVDPKRIKFYESRQPSPVYELKMEQHQPVIDVKIKHYSWVKSDAKILEKISSFSHASQVKPGWYEDVWLKWQPGSEMEVRPYGIEKSKAIKI